MTAPKTKKINFKSIFGFIKDLFSGFSDDKCLKYSASLSYYTVFSIAPMIIVIISAAGIIWGREAVQGRIRDQISGLVGPEAGEQIQSIISKTHTSGDTIIASTISIIVVVLGATAVFGEIQDSINSIWGLKSKPKRGIFKIILNRLISFSMLISLGFILMVSLTINTFVSIITSQLTSIIPGVGTYVLLIINQALIFLILSVLFGAIFKVLPDAKIKWRDVSKGAMLTAVLFMIGKYLIGIYVEKSNLTSVYGAAGSIVIIMVWVYYTAVILYFGAEFTKVYSLKYGSRIVPNDYAVWVKVNEEEQPHQTLEEAKTS